MVVPATAIPPLSARRQRDILLFSALNRWERSSNVPSSRRFGVARDHRPGMGEWHLDIYIERMKRECDVSHVTGRSRVVFRETIASSSTFDYVHKKQSGNAA